jgi:hypothetical protein
MNFQFGKRSLEELGSADMKLQLVLNSAIKKGIIDISVLTGHRGKDDQNKAFIELKSRVEWPNSKHNSLPSSAVDVAPYPIDWGEEGDKETRRKAIARFYFLAGIIMGCAVVHHVELRWGGDWDRDGDFNDQRFDDLVHFELAGASTL